MVDFSKITWGDPIEYSYTEDKPREIIRHICPIDYSWSYGKPLPIWISNELYKLNKNRKENK